jgi:acyl-CoA synthetase (AMP-forming)/AMP-acid ligase II
MTAVAAAFRASVAAWAERPFLRVLPQTALVYGEAAGTISYAAAAGQVARLEAAYRAAGYGPGHRVGLMLENRPAFFLHWLALNACGASVVPLNPDLRPAELDYLIGHSGLVLAVAARPHLPAMRAAAARAAHPVAVTLPDEAPPVPPQAWPGVDECALLYTSGTTGKPKGCILGNQYFLRAGAWYIAAGGLCAIRPGADCLITPLPMTHMNAMAYSTMAMLMSGGCIVPLDRFHPRSWWDSVRESQASIVHYLGVMPSMLLGLPEDPRDSQHRVRFGFGAGVDRRHHAIFERRFGFPLLEAWAMTETGAGAVVIANREPREVGTASFGVAEPAVEIRIVDEAGEDVADGTPGEMLVRAAGPDPRAGFFTAYLHDPEATQAAWAGGWFHTGDVVRREPGGQMIFVDRRKNVIRRSGENIAAVEVESVLRRHPAIRDVAVAATPDNIRGEEVLACVVAHETPAPGAREELAADIVRTALEEISYFKVPGYVMFVDALPLTATQKIQRGALKALARELPGTPGCIDTRRLKRQARPGP